MAAVTRPTSWKNPLPPHLSTQYRIHSASPDRAVGSRGESPPCKVREGPFLQLIAARDEPSSLHAKNGGGRVGWRGRGRDGVLTCVGAGAQHGWGPHVEKSEQLLLLCHGRRQLQLQRSQEIVPASVSRYLRRRSAFADGGS